MSIMGKLNDGLSKDEKRILNKIYWRSGRNGLLFSYTRYMGTAFAYAIYPFMNWLYPKPEDKERKIAALKRQSTFFNMNAQLFPFCIAILASMEKKLAQEKNDEMVSSIESVKASLIGPFAAIGDTIFWVTWRIIVTGLALNFSLQGSIIGPILFVLLYNIPSYVFRYVMTFAGYKLGTSFITSIGSSGIMQTAMGAINIVGLTMLGGMIPSMVSVPLTLTFKMNGIEQSLLDLFNGIVPGFLELALLLFMMRMLKKKTNPVIMVLVTFAVGIAGAAVGIF